MTTYILVAMVLGIAVGGLIHDQFADPATQKLFAGYISYRQHDLPAPDQNDHRAAGVLDTGRGHRPHVRRRRGRPRRRQGNAVVRQRLAGLADARPHPGQPVRARRRRPQGRQRRQFGDRRARHDAGRLRQARLPGFGDPSDGGERDPADRRLLDLLRRRLRRDGRTRQAGARRHRGPVPHHPARHRLCDEAGAARRVLRHGGDDRHQRSGHSGQLRQVHGPVLLRPGVPLDRADRRRVSSSSAPASSA